jgi:Domain of unknown function (DUF3303)
VPGNDTERRCHAPAHGAIEEEPMLFVCYVRIAPEHRDESFQRLKAHGIGAQPGVKMLGAWISLAQQETWAILEAENAAAIMRLYHPWTDLNVHRIEPVMSFDELKTIMAEEY